MLRVRKAASPFRYFNASLEVIRLVETVRLRWNRLGPLFAGDICRQQVSRMRGLRHWRWHLHDMYVKLNGEMVYLWRATSHGATTRQQRSVS